jgi:hypothetical protein
MSPTVNRFCCIAFVLTAFLPTATAVRVQGIEMSATDDYQRKIVNARMDRIAKANQANVASPMSKAADNATSQLFLVSFAKRVDASATLADAESYGLTVKEIHLSVGETQYAFAILPTIPASEQLANLQKNLLSDLSDTALELKQKIIDAQDVFGKPRIPQVHWWREELKAIDEFQHNYGNLPIVANGVEVLAPAAAVDRFVTSTKVPVVAVEPSFSGMKQFAIPLDVYRGPE